MLNHTCTTLLSFGLYKNVMQAFCPMYRSWLQSGMAPIASGTDSSTALMLCCLQTLQGHHQHFVTAG